MATRTKKAAAKTPAFSRLVSALEDVADALDSGDPAGHPGVRVVVRDVREVDIAAPPEFDAGRVRQLREKLGLSQAAFAKVVGSAPVTVQKWEQGRLKVQPMPARLLYLLEEAPAKTKREIVNVKTVQRA